MFSFEVEIFRGKGFLCLLFSWILKVLIVNSVNWQFSHVIHHSCRALGFFAVWECHSLCQTSSEFTRLTPRVLSGSLCCSLRLRDVNADPEVSECCDGKAYSTLGYLMLVCWGP